MQQVIEKVLKKIKPTQSTIIVEQTINEIAKALVDHDIKAKVLVGGSFAKGTYLKDKFDVDIFVKFNLKRYKGHALTPLLEEALAPFTPKIVHASRDYFEFERKGISFEVVPVLDIKKSEDADNIMDYSPLHVTWVLKHIKNFHDDIRLAKQFCKAAGVYGAESYIRGFSGHTLDILIIHYGGFVPFLHAVEEWGDKVVIDFGNQHKGKALEVLNTAKIQNPLIVVDPVFKERNAAASLDKEKYERFQEHVRAFLKNPSEKFFVEKKIDLVDLGQKGAVIIKLVPKEGKKDVLGSKLLKSYEFIKTGLQEYSVMDSGWSWEYGEDAILWYKVAKKKLDPTYVAEGPTLKQRPFVVAFKEKHASTYTEGDRIYAHVKRDCTTIKKCIALLLKDDYVKDRVKKSKVVAC